jgi:hypothetical protein
VYFGFFDKHGCTYWWLKNISTYCKHVPCNTLTHSTNEDLLNIKRKGYPEVSYPLSYVRYHWNPEPVCNKSHFVSLFYFYFYFYTVDLQRDMHYADFVVQASIIVHGLKTGNTSKFTIKSNTYTDYGVRCLHTASLKQSVVGVWITSDGRLFQSAIVLGMKLF